MDPHRTRLGQASVANRCRSAEHCRLPKASKSDQWALRTMCADVSGISRRVYSDQPDLETLWEHRCCALLSCTRTDTGVRRAIGPCACQMRDKWACNGSFPSPGPLVIISRSLPPVLAAPRTVACNGHRDVHICVKAEFHRLAVQVTCTLLQLPLPLQLDTDKISLASGRTPWRWQTNAAVCTSAFKCGVACSLRPYSEALRDFTHVGASLHPQSRRVTLAASSDISV
jgi:hypothetical protein